MSANLELLCACSALDEAEDDMPLADLGGIKKLGEHLTRLLKRLTDGDGALAA